MSTSTDMVSIERNGNRADIIIDRPEKRNALDLGLVRTLTDAFVELDDDEDVWAITLVGEGPVFCAGMDLEMMYDSDEEQHREIHAVARELFDTIGETTTPVVAGIKGAGIAAGFELTLPADFRILGADAKYGIVEIKLGVFANGGSTQRLPRLVGLAKAKELLLTGEYIDPAEAERIGLVTEVCPDDEVNSRAREFADELTKNAPLGMERALEAFQHTFDVPLSDGLDIEAYVSLDLYSTEDRKEGFKARLEGREPEFERR